MLTKDQNVHTIAYTSLRDKFARTCCTSGVWPLVHRCCIVVALEPAVRERKPKGWLKLRLQLLQCLHSAYWFSLPLFPSQNLQFELPVTSAHDELHRELNRVAFDRTGCCFILDAGKPISSFRSVGTCTTRNIREFACRIARNVTLKAERGCKYRVRQQPAIFYVSSYKIRWNSQCAVICIHIYTKIDHRSGQLAQTEHVST